MEAEMRVVSTQAKALRQLPDSGRDQDRYSLGVSKETNSIDNPHPHPHQDSVQMSGFQNCKKMSFYCFKPRFCDHLL